jgi:superkiller protein 3
MMKKIILFLLLAVVGTATLQAQKKTFVRDYTYQASEDDSRNTARTNATAQMRNILLREIGEFLHAERTTATQGNTHEYLEKIEAITAGIIEMKVLDEQWDGATFYIKAEMTVDSAEVNKRIAEVFNDKQKTKELEESRKRTLAAEAEVRKLKQELAVQKSQSLQATYVQQVENLSAEECFTRGNNASENGLYELAIENYQKAIALGSKDAWAYNNMGNAYAKLKNYNEAIRYYQKAITVDPNHTAAYYNRGIAYNNLKNYTEAIRYFQKAIDIDPNYAKAYNSMGNAYNKLKNDTEAIRCYQKVITIDPNDATAYYNMGYVYDDLRNYTEAIRCYQKAVAIDPNFTSAYYNMGIAYGNLDKKKEVIQCYQKAARLEHSRCQEWLREKGYSW